MVSIDLKPVYTASLILDLKGARQPLLNKLRLRESKA
jgi:hypothetical protein